MDSDSILRLEGVTKSFPGVKALDGVSFSIRRGEVHALVGENGAGKSTLMHIVGGVMRPDSGEIVLDGSPVSFRNAHEAHLRGIRVVFQELSIVPNLSAAENIFANIQPVNRLGFVDRRELNRRAAEMIRGFGEDFHPGVPAGLLPIGKRQVIEILKALTRHPRVILLDEPTSSLSAAETGNLFRNVRRLRETGISFVFISHHLPEVFEIADRVTVLRDGVYQGTFEVPDITEDFLIARMVGREIGDVFAGKGIPGVEKTPVLEVDGLSRCGAFEDVSFTVHAGEILGFAGLVGAGRTEIARTLFGLERPDRGTVRLSGKPILVRSPREAIARGIGYLTEDRKAQGLCLSLSVRENLIGPSLGRFASRIGLLDDRRIGRFARETVERYGIVTPDLGRMVLHLSGGNQQKVLLGMWMGIEPKVLIADEPTRGVDVGAKEEIYAHLRGLVARGGAVVLVSSDLREVIGMSDRICVMRQGRLCAVIDAADATEERVISYALGRGESAA